MKMIAMLLALAASLSCQAKVDLDDEINWPVLYRTPDACEGCDRESMTLEGVPILDSGATWLPAASPATPPWSGQGVPGNTVGVNLETVSDGGGEGGACTPDNDQSPPGCEQDDPCDFAVRLEFLLSFTNDPGVAGGNAPNLVMPGGETAQPGPVQHVQSGTTTVDLVPYEVTVRVPVDCGGSGELEIGNNWMPTVPGYAQPTGPMTVTVEMDCGGCAWSYDALQDAVWRAAWRDVRAFDAFRARRAGL